MNKLMNTKLMRLGLGCTLALLVCVSIAFGQTVTGAISGEVKDPTGAVVTGAQVVAHNLDTSVDTSTTTNAVGFYRVDFLPIGHYQVKVQANGFSTATLPTFTLEVLQTATFNVTLTVGSSSTTVNVDAAAPILNTDNATLGTTLTANAIQNMPLSGLDFSALTLYVPGAVNTAGTSGTQSIERSTSWADTPNMNGNRSQSNNYTLDGIDMNETFNNLISYSPAPEALQEMKVLTADSPADYGNVNGGGIVSVLKSGTNHFHGSIYGYVQDANVNANSWSNNNQNIKITPYTQTQFGATVGGPIKRDKLFFFADYLGARYHNGGIGTASVMTDAMRQGDFSVLLSQSAPIQLYDPLNNFAPYKDNKLAITNPVAKYIFANPKLYPDCGADNPVTPSNGKCVTPTDGISKNNYQGPSSSYKANDQGDIKLEYTPSAADKITGFYSKSTGYDGSVAVLGIFFPSASTFPTWIVGSNWVHTFSPSLVNSARIGFTRTDWNVGLPADPTGVFGTSGDSKVGISFPNQAYEGFSFQNLNGDLNGVGTAAQNNGSIIDNTYSYIDNLTWQHGRHFLSVGVQALRYQNNYPTSNNNGYLGSMNYSGVFTGASGGVGWGGADFVLDRVQQIQATLASINVGQRQWRTAGYLQDDYKLLPNLTLNAGVRYEVDEPWVEVNNKTGNINVETGQVIYADHVPTDAASGSGVCSSRGCYDYNLRQIMPRLGFSYQYNDRLVVRGGYGASSFYEGNASNQRLTSITPFIQAINTQVNQPKPGETISVANNNQPRTAEEGFTGGAANNSGTYNVYPQNIQPAYVQEWTLTGEYALTRTTSLQVGYIGEKGDHIEDYGNLNQYKTNGDLTTAPYYNNKYIGINATGASSIGANGLLITESRAMMNYNALQAVLRQRLNHGLEFTLNYTYGKAMTNSLGNYALNVKGYSGAFQNYYDSKADYGPAGYDVKHNISGTGVYALPVGRGQEYLSGISRWMDEAVGGWKIAVAGVSYSGFPETLSGPDNSSSSDSGSARPNQYRKLKVVNRSINHWFGTDPSATPCPDAGVDNGTCAFGPAAVNKFGSSSNGAVRGPGYLNVDMSAFKDFHTFRDQSVGFRFDAFNAFNIVSYGNPDTNISDSTFGQIASQESIRSQERRLQFSMHYTF